MLRCDARERERDASEIATITRGFGNAVRASIHVTNVEYYCITFPWWGRRGGALLPLARVMRKMLLDPRPVSPSRPPSHPFTLGFSVKFPPWRDTEGKGGRKRDEGATRGGGRARRKAGVAKCILQLTNLINSRSRAKRTRNSWNVILNVARARAADVVRCAKPLCITTRFLARARLPRLFSVSCPPTLVPTSPPPSSSRRRASFSAERTAEIPRSRSTRREKQITKFRFRKTGEFFFWNV